MDHGARYSCVFWSWFGLGVDRVDAGDCFRTFKLLKKHVKNRWQCSHVTFVQSQVRWLWLDVTVVVCSKLLVL